ncbi:MULTISPECIES: ABC transporter permease [unclassified Leptolyngbya]|uniref:ABC transporter permease n=1 Tax=unclassified Leptolyngbya TaxID=2650499 RepID=UPI00168204E9|nr:MULTISPECIES: ABC transporter permease [unclassified Leptolyngbya]MBD1912112.1 ABC transporter permease [Leptolyngbya sp. FACHB-8]MBD2155003.1 ABC transporter permease [Leptolyngbya sp. FACHB-16]
MSLSPLDLLQVTFNDLRGNWVRSGLTALGIFMGVAAVNATLNIDAITTTQLNQKLAERDNPYVSPFIYDPTWDKDPPRLTAEEIETARREVAGIRDYSFTTNIWGISEVQYQDVVATQVDMVGVSQNYQQTTGRQILQGRFFSPVDFEQYYAVVIVDEALAGRLFQDVSPIGQGIYIAGTRFTVIGVSETKKNWADEEPTGTVWFTQSYTSVLAGGYNMERAQLALAQLSTYKTVEESLETFFKQRYPGFNVQIGSNAEDLYKEEQQQRASARVLKGVGLLALVIGGVGIANITVAAVVERTREIGLRRALGATDLEVMAQFITEAAVLSLLGGVAAVVTVHFLTQVAAKQVFEVPYTFRSQDAAISMGAAFAVGVGASLLPALRVARLDIVDALRGD